MGIGRWLGRRLAHYLTKPRADATNIATSPPEVTAASLRKGDVLLVEGTSRISGAIKYLTQSTWSHAALYTGDALDETTADGEPLVLVEADVEHGVRGVPLSEYNRLHTRICRPVGLSDADLDAVVGYAAARLGYQYDLKNIFDLARYAIRTPPVPEKWRRRMLALGSGDPTQAICSSLIARAFQSVRYPILPHIDLEATADDPACASCYREILHIRHHSLFVPRDFDVSPYFRIVKPTVEHGFDPRVLAWADDEADAAAGEGTTAARA